MNTGQMMLTLGAITLFGLQILNLSRNELGVSDDVNQAKFKIMAVALAKSTIDNAFALKFDEKTIYADAYPDANGKPTSASFTAATSLGCAANEKTSGKPDAAKFNDFDDYHGYTAKVDSLPSAVFNISSTVSYVDATNDFESTTTPTWDKQIIVTITSPSLPQPIVLTAVNSYWKY